MTIARLLRIIVQRLRSMARSRAQDRALDDEVAFHLEELIAERIAEGLTPIEARRAALRDFGNVALVVEDSRDTRRLRWWHDLAQDARYGLRMIRLAPGFSAVAIASLAIGIGASAAVLTSMRALLLEPLPFHDADRLVVVRTIAPDAATRDQGVSLVEYTAWKEHNRTLDDIALSLSSPREIGAEPGGPVGERLASQAFTPNLFHMLGVRPARGRAFDDVESPLGAGARVMLISHRLWQRRYGGAPDIVGRVVPSHGTARTIVGVLPPDFRFQDDNVDFWIPLIPTSASGTPAGIGRPFGVTARLRPGVSLAEAHADLKGIITDLERTGPAGLRARDVRVIPLRDAMYGWTRPLLYTLLGAVALMLTIACANVAGLLLARGMTRQSELWVRLSLGAGHGRILRQLFTESLLLAAAGGLIGLALAALGLRWLVAAMGPPPGTPRIAALPFEPTTIVIALVLSLGAAMAISIVPARAAARRAGPVQGRAAPPAEGDLRSTRVRSALVVAQVAMAMPLLIGAGLLVTSYVRLAHRELNFDPEGLTSFQYVVERQDFVKPAGFDGVLPMFELAPLAADAIARVHERLRVLPGVDAVGGMTYQPVNSFIIPRFPVRPADVAEHADPVSREAVVAGFMVTPGVFAAMRTPILKGREVSDTDVRHAAPVVVINQAAERLLFAGHSALGRRLFVELSRASPARDIIGVVADVPMRRRVLDPEPIVYLPSAQMPPVFRGGGANFFGVMTFVLRHSTDEASMIDAVRRAVAEVDPVRPIVDVGVVGRALEARLPELAGYVSAVVGFGIVAVLLAAVGVYGMTSFTVAVRTRELSIRRALGAGPREVIAAVGKRALWLAALGIVAGLAIAAAVTRLIAAQLVGVGPTDPATFAAAAVLLAVLTVLACLGPARHALGIDPARVLRSE